MLISKTAITKWGSKNYKKLTSLGYLFTGWGEPVTVRIEDLGTGSRAEVQYECDYCHKVFKITYHTYMQKKMRNNIKEDCCKNCLTQKIKQSLLQKYGTSNINDLQQVNQKRKNTNLQRYGVEYAFQNKEIQQKRIKTNIERYGVPATTQVLEFKQKGKKTCLQKYGTECYAAYYAKTHTGSKSPQWKGQMTNNNKRDRTSSEYDEWRLSVFERDNYTCQCCKSRNKKGLKLILNAHHIVNFSSNQKQRFDINNGITLCKQCHLMFHKLFGETDNNRDQLDEFLLTYPLQLIR